MVVPVSVPSNWRAGAAQIVAGRPRNIDRTTAIWRSRAPGRDFIGTDPRREIKVGLRQTHVYDRDLDPKRAVRLGPPSAYYNGFTLIRLSHGATACRACDA